MARLQSLRDVLALEIVVSALLWHLAGWEPVVIAWVIILLLYALDRLFGG